MTVVRADALRIPLRDNSVDLIITSPPYFALRSYRDGDEHYAGQVGSEESPQAFLEALWAVTADCRRVLKPSGSMFVNLGDKYAGSGGHNNAGVSDKSTLKHDGRARPRPVTERELELRQLSASRRNAPDRYQQNSGGIPAKSLMGLPWRYANGVVDQLGLILRAEIIWSKPNGLPESVTDRVRRSHEQWFHFVRQGRYFAAVDEIREAPASADRLEQYGVTYRDRVALGMEDTKANGNRGLDATGKSLGMLPANPLGKLPGSVWTIPSEPLVVPAAVQTHYGLPDHFAAFPQEWPRRLILGWSPSGVCTVCGEGRRPVVESKYVPARARGGDGSIKRNRPILSDLERPNGEGVGAINSAVLDKDSTITGYACACTPHTDHPERRGTSFINHDDATVAGATASGAERNKAYREGRSGPSGPVREYDLTVPLPPTRPAVVLDPFGGTGTVAMVARTLGRTGINLDLSADYCRLARWRIYQSGHAAKSEERTWRDAQGVML